MKTYNVEDVFVSVGFPEHTYISREKIEREMKLGKVNRAKQYWYMVVQKWGKVIFGENIFLKMKLLKSR
ncbi:hypothetical protein HU186_12555 [Bacillus paralicheniformis]|uniref:hypothetical protein n=1 Tax=Bacillus paralicheniformis TaxID=1648923 RepID=UPI001CC546BE|nr:hypothetical protein [Bacillus paralicheniformis]MBZ5215161.1 hypothetical protein [Bacillus paralicheniformis]